MGCKISCCRVAKSFVVGYQNLLLSNNSFECFLNCLRFLKKRRYKNGYSNKNKNSKIFC